jgi:hypothetical protein
MLVVDLMSSPDGLEIPDIGVPEILYPLVDEYLMYQEIGESVKGDAQPGPEEYIVPVLHAEKQAGHARNGENEEKEIIPLKEAICFFLMVIAVK